MNTKFKFFSSLMLMNGFFFIASGADNSKGIEFYKSGQLEPAKAILLQELNNSADKSTVCYYLGEIYFTQNKVDSAAYYYNKGKALNPENTINSIGAAKLIMKTKLEESEDQIDDALSGKNKKNPTLVIAAARAYLDNGNFEKAFELQMKAKELNPKNPDVYVLEGDILAAKKAFGDACGKYEQAIYFDPNCKEAYFKYARFYTDINPGLAIEKLNQLIALDPKNPIVHRELAEVYYENEQFTKAAQEYDIYINQGHHTDHELTRYATVLFFNKDYAKSAEVIKKVLSKDPNNFVMKRISMYNAFELKDYDKALAIAKDFFSTPNNPEYIYLDHYYYGRLLDYLKKNNEAIAQYQIALKMDPTKVELLKEIASTYNDMNDYPKAIEVLTNYIKTGGEAVKVLDYFTLGKYNYSAAQSIKDVTVPGELEKKKAYFQQADSLFGFVAEKVPDNHLGLLWRARTQSAMDPECTTDGAKQYFESVLTLAEKNPDKNKDVIIECLQYMGVYYIKRNDAVKSKSFWNRILSLDPANEQAKSVLKQLK